MTVCYILCSTEYSPDDTSTNKRSFAPQVVVVIFELNEDCSRWVFLTHNKSEIDCIWLKTLEVDERYRTTLYLWSSRSLTKLKGVVKTWHQRYDDILSRSTLNDERYSIKMTERWSESLYEVSINHLISRIRTVFFVAAFVFTSILFHLWTSQINFFVVNEKFISVSFFFKGQVALRLRSLKLLNWDSDTIIHLFRFTLDILSFRFFNNNFHFLLRISHSSFSLQRSFRPNSQDFRIFARMSHDFFKSSFQVYIRLRSASPWSCRWTPFFQCGCLEKLFMGTVLDKTVIERGIDGRFSR